MPASNVFKLLVLFAVAGVVAGARGDDSVEQWGVYEVSLKGPASGNPFTEATLSAKFTNEDKAVEVAGFYDGEGTYRIRFMPGRRGAWRYETRSNREELNGKTGQVTCVAPSAGGRSLR
jgi:hypothetical protein